MEDAEKLGHAVGTIRQAVGFFKSYVTDWAGPENCHCKIGALPETDISISCQHGTNPHRSS